MITAQELKERIEITKQEQSTDKFCDVCFTISDFGQHDSNNSSKPEELNTQSNLTMTTTTTSTITAPVHSNSNESHSSILSDLKKETAEKTEKNKGEDSDFSDSDDEREK